MQITSATKSKTLFTLLACILLAASAASWAQGDFKAHPMRFEHLTLEDGLSQSNVLSIHQD